MSTRPEVLPSPAIANREPLPGSRKVYVPGPGGMRVPFREIRLQSTRGLGARVEPNAPLRVYDTSGPYTDSDIDIDLHLGLPELRREWIDRRGPYEVSSRKRSSAPHLALTRP